MSRKYTSGEVCEILKISPVTIKELKRKYGLKYDRRGQVHLLCLGEVGEAIKLKIKDASADPTPTGKRNVKTSDILTQFRLTSKALVNLREYHGLRNDRPSSRFAYYCPDEVREAINKRNEAAEARKAVKPKAKKKKAEQPELDVMPTSTGARYYPKPGDSAIRAFAIASKSNRVAI